MYNIFRITIIGMSNSSNITTTINIRNPVIVNIYSGMYSVINDIGYIVSCQNYGHNSLIATYDIVLSNYTTWNTSHGIFTAYRSIFKNTHFDWNTTISSFIILDYPGKYTFYNYVSDYCGSQLLLNGEEIFNSIGLCINKQYIRTVDLKAGIQNLTNIMFCVFGSEWYYSLQYSNDTMSRRELPEHYYYAPIKTLPSVEGLSVKQNKFAFALGSPVHIDLLIKNGNITTCKSDKDLPLGLYFNGTIIEGNTNMLVNDYNDYTITCENNYTVTNPVVLTLKVIKNYEHGVKSYYIKSNNYDKECKIEYSIYNENVTTEIIRIENTINKDRVDEFNTWNGLSYNFQGEYSTLWEGYIYIDHGDNYNFKLNSIGGSWLYINYHHILNNTGCNIYKSSNITIYLEEGYSRISVLYSVFHGYKEINIQYKHKNDDEYKDITEILYYGIFFKFSS